MNTTNIHYKDGDQDLEGYVAYDPAISGKRPAVLIAHAWGGLLDFEREKAEALARLGYVGFAIDVYGTGKRGGSVEENLALMQPFMEDRGLVRRRMQAAVEAARSHEAVDPGRIAVIGYCFGGLCVLDLARSGAEVAGVVSFHGMLAPPGLSDNPETFAAKVLVLHGHDDPLVPQAQVAGLTEELTRAKVDWQVHSYGHTLHAFTNPEANDPTGLGALYDATADSRSWVAMKNFLAELFGE